MADTRDIIAKAAEARSNLTLFATIQAICESPDIRGEGAQAYALKIARLCAQAVSQEANAYNRAIARAAKDPTNG